MKSSLFSALTRLLFLPITAPAQTAGQACVDCHGRITPGILADWRASKHDAAGVECATCRGFGMASCDACHTRHAFSIAEARSPQACQTRHLGFDHPQWEMYSSSKHGVRHALQQLGVLPASAAGPQLPGREIRAQAQVSPAGGSDRCSPPRT